MPLEFLATYAATKALDTLLFSEKRNFSLLNKKIAERYLKMSAPELITMYRNETPIEIELAGTRYILPMSLELNLLSGDREEISCVRQNEKFSVDDSLIEYTNPIIDLLEKDKKSFNGSVVRLHSSSNNQLVLQEASYFEGVATNFGMDHMPQSRSQTLRELVHGAQQSFGCFNSSHLVNHIGVVCMVETCDGMLIVQRRSNKVTNRSGTLSSSVSGAINWSDIQCLDKSFSISTIGYAMAREALEELGVHIEKLQFLGLIREFLRGGKPELYFFARTKEPYKGVLKKWGDGAGGDKDESKGLVGHEFLSDSVIGDELSKDQFKLRLKNILDAVSNDANLTLVAGILLSGQYLLKKEKHA